ncbi:heme-degrading domain-containing protein [Pseudorhodobacter sp.]|uniref:heme-degrading domain-containing protein n=1 Tax=Pseudorhodobacter sp. TaxID=1934400 RepID=UPI002AFE159C|nr:heme-degrading domain-containing protein [Pseudorhodobacter sp.]
MDIATLKAQESTLQWPSFGAEDALTLGLILLDMGRAASLPIAINIRTANQTLFHAALPGAAPLNDLWALRKSNTVLKYHMSSLHVGERMRASGKGFAIEGLSETEHAAHGGSFPIRLHSGLVVAAVTVSGLPQVDDHALVVAAIEKALAA